MLYVVFKGFILGAVYTLAAIGLSLQWGILKNFNFSHGACMSIGGYIMWVALREGLSYFSAFVVVVVVLFFIGIAIEKIAIQPFFGKNEANVFIATVALSSIISQVLLLIFEGKAKDLTPLVEGNVKFFGNFTATYHGFLF